MIGNRPIGVRNPVCFTFLTSSLRAKNAGSGSPEFCGKPYPGDSNKTVSPFRLLEAALTS